MMKVATHNGKMHADEVFATVFIQKKFGSVEVVRTRDESLFQDCELVYDVGLKFDNEKWFDHHQPTKELRKNGIPYAACGLIWRKFGHDIIRDAGVAESDIQQVFERLDHDLVMGIDAMDNGFKLESNLRQWTVSDIIGGFNPSWDNESDPDVNFHKAVSFATTIFEHALEEQLAIVRSKMMIESDFQNRPCPEILVLEKGCNWTQHLLKLDVKKEVLFVVYPDRNNGYKVQNVPVELGTFTARKKLPSSWKVETAEELNRIIGISDAIFCHSELFVAGAHSLESILKMAKIAVNA